MANKEGIEPIYITVKEAAASFGLSTWQMNNLLNDEPDSIDSRYLGKRRLVSVQSLREYADSLPTERPQAAS